MGQLTLNGSTVSNNTTTSGDGGGIFNCGANPASSPLASVRVRPAA